MDKPFEPLPLTEGNVQLLLDRCRRPADGREDWDTQALAENRRAIRYLLGQLALCHEGPRAHPADEAFCRRYDGAAWTAQPQRVMDLLTLGLRVGALTLRREDRAVLLAEDLRPTLSPEDPAFPTWYAGERPRWEPRSAPPQPPKICGETLRRLLAQAQAGDAQAQYRCGAMLYQGEETDPDPAAALYWLEQAARQGHADAQCNCGTFYYNGIGTDPDPAQALLWYEQAAQQGNCAAQFNCGLLYSEGQGTAPNPARAFHWYEQAARQGHPGAQCNCGILCFNGQGTPRDPQQAKAWFEKAAAQGDDFARQVLQENFPQS